MTLAVFPALPGLSWNVIKSPEWNTAIQRSVSGKELRVALYSYPTWKFSLSYEVLRAGSEQELQVLMGFFNARKGAFEPFLFDDPTDNTVTGQIFGYGDGVQTKFQLSRQITGIENIEPVFATNGTPHVFITGAETTAWSVSNGLVTFSSPPPTGSVLTWTGGFYFRVRFDKDSADFDNFMYRLWQLKKLELVTFK